MNLHTELSIRCCNNICHQHCHIYPCGDILLHEGYYSKGVRAKALGISKASNWLFTYAVLQLTPIMPQKIHGRTYYFFGAMYLIIAIIAHWQFPKARGKLLEEVDLIFSGKYNFYDAFVEHPQTAVALAQIEKVQHHENICRFPVVALILKAMDAA